MILVCLGTSSPAFNDALTTRTGLSADAVSEREEEEEEAEGGRDKTRGRRSQENALQMLSLLHSSSWCLHAIPFAQTVYTQPTNYQCRQPSVVKSGQVGAERNGRQAKRPREHTFSFKACFILFCAQLCSVV